MTIAIAEDNTTTRRELSRLLTSHGYETVLPDDFKDLAGQLAGLSADLILLDVNLPYENGYDICRRIRELTRTPVIFVTSRDTSADELMSIRAGGIDFVSKPYDPLILLEKIRRALRLTDPGNFRELTRKGCTLDLHLSVIRYSGREAELTRNEFRILYYFFMNSGKVIGKEELLEKLWNDRFYLDENVLMVNMTRLKHKLREIGITHLLENIRGKGNYAIFSFISCLPDSQPCFSPPQDFGRAIFSCSQPSLSAPGFSFSFSVTAGCRNVRNRSWILQTACMRHGMPLKCCPVAEILKAKDIITPLRKPVRL